MKKFHMCEPYDIIREYVNWMALNHRKQFGECPSIGTTMETLYKTYLQTPGSPNYIKGGGPEPLNYALMTPAGLVTLFEDSACYEAAGPLMTAFSVEEPDAE